MSFSTCLILIAIALGVQQGLQYLAAALYVPPPGYRLEDGALVPYDGRS